MKTKKLVSAGLLLAVGWLLPLLTGQLQSIGNMFCPMHLPVMLGGFVLGPAYGLLLGLLTPLSRSLIFGMPMLYPAAIGMAFELAAYGFFCGALYKTFEKYLKARVYLALVLSMLIGRLVWAAARLVMLGVTQTPLTWKIFVTTEFVNAWPGIVIQLVLIPKLVQILENAGLFDRK